VTRQRISAQMARELRKGRESKGAWDAGADNLYAGHDTCPRHRGDAANERIRCECRAVGVIHKDGDRALCAAAPGLTEEVEHLTAECERLTRAFEIEQAETKRARGERDLMMGRLDVATKERDHAIDCAKNARAELDKLRVLLARRDDTIAGRWRRPTVAEAHEHQVRAGGKWLIRFEGGHYDEVTIAEGRVVCSDGHGWSRDAFFDGNPGVRIWPLGVTHTVCAWPEPGQTAAVKQ